MQPCTDCASPIAGHHCPNGPTSRALDILGPCLAAGALTYPGTDGQHHYARVVGRIGWSDDRRPFLTIERGYYGPGRIFAEDRPRPYRPGQPAPSAELWPTP